MAEMTLKEVCEMAQITRRALQGYEEKGLVFPTGENKYKHNLYDENAQRRILEVKTYQDMGFSLSQISDIYQMDRKELLTTLQNQEDFLKKRAISIQKSITTAENMIKALLEEEN